MQTGNDRRNKTVKPLDHRAGRFRRRADGLVIAHKSIGSFLWQHKCVSWWDTFRAYDKLFIFPFPCFPGILNRQAKTTVIKVTVDFSHKYYYPTSFRTEMKYEVCNYLIYCLLHISAHSSLVSDTKKRFARRQKRKNRRRAVTSLYPYALHGGLRNQAAVFFYVRRLGEAAAVIPIPYWPGRFEGLPSKKALVSSGTTATINTQYFSI